jgi:hypothetical protein
LAGPHAGRVDDRARPYGEPLTGQLVSHKRAVSR